MSRRSPLLLLVPFALAIGAGVCSSNSPSATGDSPATTPGTEPGSGEIKTIEVTLSDDGCAPRNIAAQAGPTTFKVTNDGSASVTEFEVLEGSTILGEVENVIPGAEREFAITLKPGTYSTLCPNGAQHDKGAVEVAAAPSGVAADDTARKKAVATYLDSVKGDADTLITRTGAFAAAVKAGDIAGSKALFASAREPYEAIEPIAESFGDLDPAIDAREGDVEPPETWGGFHRIEKALWEDGSVADMGPVADKLVADVKDLRTKIDGIELEPAQIANGAVELLNEVSVSKITGEEDRYSHTDLSDFNGNLAGARDAFTALEPLIKSDHADLAAELTTKLAAVQSALDKYKGADPVGNGYVLYSTLTPEDTKTMSTSVDTLAEPLSTVAAIVIV